jgi:hypothetical protein
MKTIQFPGDEEAREIYDEVARNTIGDLSGTIGDLSTLNTTNKTSLVDALNDVISSSFTAEAVELLITILREGQYSVNQTENIDNLCKALGCGIDEYPGIADKVFEIGEKVWVTGFNTVPLFNTVSNGEWKRVLEDDGTYAQREGCKYSAYMSDDDRTYRHEHSAGCRSSDYPEYVCGLPEHTNKSHALECSEIDSEYLWRVEEKA